jgi:hypothetical protein
MRLHLPYIANYDGAFLKNFKQLRTLKPAAVILSQQSGRCQGRGNTLAGACLAI